MPDSLFRELADYAPVMIWRSAPDGLCDWVNKPWLDFVGAGMETEIGEGWLARVHPEDRDRVAGAYRDAFDRRERFSMTYRLRRHDGAWRSMLHNGAPFARSGAFAGYFGSCTDVTEQQQTYARLQQAYRERDGLLREIYHRVKNNLQQIQGLIAMEAATLSDPLARESLDALTGRVRSMGLVHQMLLRSKDLIHISARAFIEALCEAIGSAAGAGRRGIELKIAVDDGEVDIERAVVKGLIVNELVANCLKHAFPEGRGGAIHIRFFRTETGESIVEVEDDGVGFQSRDLAGVPGSHIGMTLVRGLAAQLDGRIEQTAPSGGGCLFRITFPKPRPAKARL